MFALRLLLINYLPTLLLTGTPDVTTIPGVQVPVQQSAPSIEYRTAALQPINPIKLPLAVRQVEEVKAKLQPAIPLETVAAPTVTGAPIIVESVKTGNNVVSNPVRQNWREWMFTHTPQAWHMMHALTFAAIVKALCMTGNVIVQVSPYPQVRRWEARQNTGESDAAPYVSIMFGGWQWCLYGTFAWLVTKRSGFLILVHSNCLGAALGTYYTVAFYRNCCSEPAFRNLHRYLIAIATLAAFQATALLVLPAERALFLCGLISSFCSFLAGISMMVTVPTVLRTKDSRSIPGPVVLSSFGSSLVWCVCGWMLQDPLVLCPNIASTFAGLICIILKLKFPTSSKYDDDCESSMECAVGTAGMGTKYGDLHPACKPQPTERTPLVPTATKFSRSSHDTTNAGDQEAPAEGNQMTRATLIEELDTSALEDPEVHVERLVKSVPSMVFDGTGGTC